MSVYKDNME